jgi:hypoxanthine-DNA glycosylase
MSEGAAKCVGFKAVARSDARVLILGTLPGAESLKRRQYYAKPQNSFWEIMGELVGATPDLPYAERKQRLTEHGIALWDVCAMAERKGSLDAAIRSPTPNDFAAFFKTHPDIELICFNGQAAEKLFRRYVTPRLPENVLCVPGLILPSTSPAHAGMPFEQKLAHWREALGKFL